VLKEKSSRSGHFNQKKSKGNLHPATLLAGKNIHPCTVKTRDAPYPSRKTKGGVNPRRGGSGNRNCPSSSDLRSSVHKKSPSHYLRTLKRHKRSNNRRQTFELGGGGGPAKRRKITSILQVGRNKSSCRAYTNYDGRGT